MRNPTLVLAAAAALLVCAAQPAFADPADVDTKSPKQLNDPLPPVAMPPDSKPPGAVPTPRGTPEGMGNETDFTKTPGDDDPSDGTDEPGRNPVPGLPRRAPGAEAP